MFHRLPGLMLLVTWAGFAADTPARIAIRDFSLHQYEDGPPLQSNHYFMVGELVFVSARFAGYAKTEAERPKIKISYHFESLDPEGVPVAEPVKGMIDTELSPQDKEWLPKVRHDFPLPPLADPGTYKVVLSVKDELSGATDRKEMPVSVRGHEVEPSDTLTIRNFRFLRSEEDTAPLTTPAYRPGEPVWARFDITGYKIGEKNRYSVSYGLEVSRSDGESLYKEPTAAEKDEEVYYRKRYMPGVINVNPSDDIAKGEYWILVRTEDRLAGTNYESKFSFFIE